MTLFNIFTGQIICSTDEDNPNKYTNILHTSHVEQCRARLQQTEKLITQNYAEMIPALEQWKLHAAKIRENDMQRMKSGAMGQESNATKLFNFNWNQHLRPGIYNF